MGKLSKKLVSIVTTLVVSAGLAFTSLPAVEAKATTTNINIGVIPSELTYSGDVRKALPEEKEEVEVPSAADYGLCDNTKDGAILHAFCWSFNTIKDNMKDIAEAGYTTVQTSPANRCNDSHPGMKLYTDENGTGGCWWWHYQPTDWTIGNYQLGTRDDYKAMCEEADKYGVKIITDVLPNHTTPDLPRVSQNLANAAGGMGKGQLYHSNGFTEIGDYNDRYQCTLQQMGGLPDVNTENQGFQEYYLKYCNDIISLGCDGFRYDTAKHIGVPSDPKDSSNTRGVNDFWDVATGRKAVNGVSLANKDKLFIYGEVLQDRNIPYQEYASYMNMTASSYGDTLRGAIGSKDFSTGRIMNWNHATPDRIVTWVESHDTYCNSHPSAWMSDWDIRMCWAIIAARENGTPLFFSRPDGSNGSSGNYWGNNVLGAKGNDEFKAPEVAAVNKFRNAMLGEKECLRNPNGNSKILQIDRGTKGTVIINLGDSTTISSQTTVADGTYTDQVTGNQFTVSGGTISGKLEGGKVHVIYKAGPVKKTPKITVTPSTSTFTSDTLDVTLKVDNATSATYTTSEGDSGSISSSKVLTIGSQTSFGGKVTVTVKASNADGDSEETFTYTKKEPLKVKKGGLYLTKPSGWSTPSAYVYDESTGTAKEIKAWPGVAMSDEGDGVYFYQLPDEWQTANTKIIFTDGTNKCPSGSLAPGHAYVVGTATMCDGTTFEDVKVSDEQPLSIGSTSVNLSSPQKVNTTIKITAGSVTGGTAPYKYTIKAGTETLVSNSTTNSVSWTPSTAGNYNISVTVTDSKGNTKSASSVSYVIEKDIISNPIAISSFKATSPSSSSATLGSTISLSAAATGGNSTLKYKIVAELNGTETTIKSYSTSKTCTWTPTKAGTYTLTLYVTDGTETKTRLMSYTISGSTLKLTSFKTSVASPQAVGKAITLSASATGSGTVRYHFYVYSGSTLKAQSSLSTTKTYSWKPTVAGTYTLKVAATDATGKIVSTTKTYKIVNSLKITSFTTSVASPQYTGTAITLKAAATGSGTVKYHFYVYLGTTLKAQSSLSTTKTYSWKPTVKGTYTIKVAATDSTGKIVTTSKSYVIKQKTGITIKSLTTSKASPQQAGTAITLTASATTTTGTQLQYAFSVHNGLMGWTNLKKYSTTNTVTWKPAASGTYTVWVQVKDAKGYSEIKTLSYVITDKIVNIEENNSKITCSSGWMTATSTAYSGGKCKYASTSGAKMSFKFTGTGIKIYGSKAPNRGMAKVTVDGKSQYVDFYNATEKNKQLVLSLTGLTSTTHTITIEVVGAGNLNSTGTVVAIDKFSILNGTIA